MESSHHCVEIFFFPENFTKVTCGAANIAYYAQRSTRFLTNVRMWLKTTPTKLFKSVLNAMTRTNMWPLFQMRQILKSLANGSEVRGGVAGRLFAMTESHGLRKTRIGIDCQYLSTRIPEVILVTKRESRQLSHNSESSTNPLKAT